MEGLSRLLAQAKRDGKLYGLKVNDFSYLTHLLFVDDVLVFLNGSIRGLASFSNIFPFPQRLLSCRKIMGNPPLH